MGRHRGKPRGLPAQRKPLKNRDYEVDLTSRLGKMQYAQIWDARRRATGVGDRVGSFDNGTHQWHGDDGVKGSIITS